jgi:hypothetical protein
MNERSNGEYSMSFASQQPTMGSTPATKNLILVTLILSVALAATTTTSVVFALLYLRQPAIPVTAGKESSATATREQEPYVQKDSVSPQKFKVRHTGTVYYPWPYASPPNLKLTDSKRSYDIIKEDEYGFTWYARLALADFNELTRKAVEKHLGEGPLDNILQITGFVLDPSAEFEDFTWEAKGMPASKETMAMRIFQQEGTFPFADKEGTVTFPIPYATAPNVELSETLGRSIDVVESRPTGFKWKHVGAGSPDNISIHWTAKGIRAKEIPKSNPG